MRLLLKTRRRGKADLRWSHERLLFLSRLEQKGPLLGNSSWWRTQTVWRTELSRELSGRLVLTCLLPPDGIKMPFHLNDEGR